MSIDNEFSYDEFEKEALIKLKQGVSLEGKDGVLAPLLKRLLEAGLEGEMDGHLIEEKAKDSSIRNRRNGINSKKVKTHYGTIDVTTPRDRQGSFEPGILPRRHTTLGSRLDHKIISSHTHLSLSQTKHILTCFKIRRFDS